MRNGYSPHEIDSIIDALRDAWKCDQTVGLDELMSVILPEPMANIDTEDVLELVNEFVIQNTQ